MCNKEAGGEGSPTPLVCKSVKNLQNNYVVAGSEGRMLPFLDACGSVLCLP